VGQAAAQTLRPESVWAEPAGLFISLGGGVATGSVPALTPALSVATGMLGRGFRSAARFGYALPQLATLRESKDAGARVALLVGALEAGPRFAGTRFELSPVLGFETGAYRTDVVGAKRLPVRAPLRLASYLGLDLGLVLGRVFLIALRAEAVWALSRPRFALRDEQGQVQGVFAAPALGARGFLELEARLP
jgi:hypothetical protein